MAPRNFGTMKLYYVANSTMLTPLPDPFTVTFDLVRIWYPQHWFISLRQWHSKLCLDIVANYHVSWRERVDTASAIKGILDSYPSNSILREILQNSDDAGASKQIFILDHRHHGAERVIEPRLKQTQGPALLAFNDSVFTESDWEAVRTIHGSNKTADAAKTGKYGLGIRACYHVTDNIHILSGKQLVIFDPHEEFTTFAGGLSIPLDETVNYQDQILAFSGALVERPSSHLNATVVRLPLRTSVEAQRSKIKPLSVTIADIQALYQSFIQNELSVALLFLKNILSIELREIALDGQDVLLAQVSILNNDVASIRKFVPGHDDRRQSYTLDILTTVSGSSSSQSWRIVHVVVSEESAKAKMESRLDYDVGERLRKDKLLPHVALAFPLSSQDIQGRLFTLLPLPISTGLPLHVHGIFALTPDRQSLRNPEELGIGPESRERLLVAWNRMLFEDLIPKAWAVSMLHALVDQDDIEDIWSAWPPEHTHISHLTSILTSVAKETLASTNGVFPVLTLGKRTFVGSNHVALVAAADIDRDLINAVSRTGVAIITPPEYIFSALQNLGFKGCEFKSFGAKNLHGLLNQQFNQRQNISSDEDKLRIMEYLVFTSTDYILGLPLIPTVGGYYISLSKPTSGSIRYILATAEEIKLFSSCNQDMINISSLPEKAQDRIEKCALGQKMNIIRLGPVNVEDYLTNLLGDSVEITPSGPDILWFSSFWSWIDRLCDPSDFLKIASAFHLLPMRDAKSLRKVSKKAFLCPEDKAELSRVLVSVGIPFLHSVITSTKTLSDSGFIMSIENLPNLMSFVNPNAPSPPAADNLVLQEHFIRCIELKKPVLNSKQRKCFKTLSVFPVRIPRVSAPVTELRPATGSLRYVAVSDDFPLPIVENLTYIDMSGPSRVLVLTMEPDALGGTLGEVGLMELAVRHLSMQPAAMQDVLMRKVIPRLFDVSPDTRETLKHQIFIPTIGSLRRVSPAEIIDPESPLANLFTGEPGRFPMRPYSDHIFLSLMRTACLYSTRLSLPMLRERIRYISSEKSDPLTMEKAKSLLLLLSSQWNPLFVQAVQTIEWIAWIPTTSNTLVSRQQCRDEKHGLHHFLFDFVFCTVSAVVSDEVRTALDWASPLKFNILEQQLQLTLQRPNIANIPERLLRLIAYLAKQHSTGALTAANIQSLKALVRDRHWIPLSASKLALSQHAFLKPGIKIGDTFESIPKKLQQQECMNFLRAMGLSDWPSIDSLIQALIESETLDQRIAFLSELSSPKNRFTDQQRDSILAPDFTSALRRLSELYYNDLGVPFLSSLRLDSQDDIDIDNDVDGDDDDMAESLIERIRSVLVDYDIQYSFNEFLANAVDAGASQFKVLLDTKLFGSSRVLCSEMSIFQQGPAMVLYNNAVFSNEDFRGVRKIGEGGKKETSGTIGKFGLGALSFYHFSEVAFIVSGEFILILDPLASHLPKRRGQMQRRRSYSDHLLPFDGLFGFSLDMDSYPGRCRSLVTGPYQKLSRAALFFTSLKTIVALERVDNILATLWTVEATVIPAGCLDRDREYMQKRLLLTLRTNGVTHQRHWLIMGTTAPLADVPPSFMPVILQLKATGGVKISLAFDLNPHQLELDESESQYHLFCGLQLPEVHTLPVHIDATFASSTDRRSIRFDPPDGNGVRPVLQSEYNAWLLSQAIPPLYYHGLHIMFPILHERRRQHEFASWWPKRARGPISVEILNAFYESLPKATIPIFPTVTNELIAPQDAVISGAEPHLVRKLFHRLKIPNFVVFHVTSVHIASHLHTKSLPTIDTETTARILKQSTVEKRLRDLFHDDIQAWARSPQPVNDEPRMTVVSMIDATLSFLLQGHSFSDNLLLLVTDDLVLRRLSDSVNPIYHFIRHYPDQLFPRSRFLTKEFSPVTQALLTEAVPSGVQLFNHTAVLSFLNERVGSPRRKARHFSDTAQWIALFWEYFNSHKLLDLKLEHVANYPLLPTIEEGEFLSLEECRCGGVLFDPQSTELRGIMLILGIPVLLDHRALSDDSSFKFSFKNFLECIMKRGGDPFDILNEAHSDWLVSWITNEMTYGLHKLDKATHLALLATLPLWKSTRNGIIQRLSANEINQIPSDIELSRISRFLDPAQSIGEYAPELLSLWSALKDIRSHSTSHDLYIQLRQLLLLPIFISENDISDYKYLIEKLARRHNIPGLRSLMVPDSHLQLRSAQEYFDSNSEIFRAAFHYREDEMFLHPEFRDLQSLLGVTVNVTLEIFRRCARAIHDDQLYGRNNEIITRATTVYTYYNHLLPSQIMTNAISWESLDDLRFIPRKNEPLEGFSYDATLYFSRPDSLVVSPRELLRDEYQHIAWTQRAGFLIPPTLDLIAVYPDIGSPTEKDVVAHLKILATQVSVNHPYNRGLVRDLKATYKWLQDNRVKAKYELRKHKSEKIFLNIDNIDSISEVWEWRSADELILDLLYDSQKCFRVRSFLYDYRNLLTGAGVRERVDVTLVDETHFGDPNFDRLRKGKKLLDIELRPEFVGEDGMVEDLSRLKAHAAFLAANVAHIEEALTGGWNEGKTGSLSFPGTFFAACAFLDLLYTGDVNVERPPVYEDALRLLDELLKMLEVADMWNLPALKKKLGWLITSKYQFIQLETLMMIQEEALKYNAPELADACIAFGEKNAEILVDLDEEDNQEIKEEDSEPWL
ncbi:hypothetical protein F5890DRAFT_1474609 [Lentinula detonsa]|uniref:Sacsin/Nov domain-containing protein n=1 Tax=Lentinula detonsa TaxID=2804962 RepID=A0AA38Q062_9AGAR|nr:hypothetical protein F5890DRAFT_1474609 [Lentinula detonsa]